MIEIIMLIPGYNHFAFFGHLKFLVVIRTLLHFDRIIIRKLGQLEHLNRYEARKYEIRYTDVDFVIKVSPSVISCNLEILGEQIAACDKAGAFSYHLDVMDGHFVPNLTMGPDLVKAIRNSTKKPLETHLMIERPDHYYKSFIDAGSNTLLVHQECLVNLKKLFSDIKEKGAGVGVVINPETPVSAVHNFLEDSEILLIMSVHPGFSGQKFIDYVLPKISEAKAYIREHGFKTQIEVDGGVNDLTGKKAAKAGADILVSASYIFSGNIGERVKTLQDL